MPALDIPISSKQGLHVIHEPAPPESPLYSIVFVHGLGGSARETWTHAESGGFWPEWLAQEEVIRDARIMTFGYNAKVNNIYAPRVVLGVFDWAMKLLESVTTRNR